MGGWLSPAWRHALWWLTGSTAYDAYIERMLMTVILVKDQVEQSRFAVKPTVIRTQVEPAVEAKQAPSADLDFQVGGHQKDFCGHPLMHPPASTTAVVLSCIKVFMSLYLI